MKSSHPDPPDSLEPRFQQARPVLFLTFIFVLNFTARIVAAPLLPAMEHDLSISHARSGMFFLCLAAGYCGAMLASGYLSARIHHRRTIILSCTALGLSLMALSLAPTFAGIGLGFFSVGCGAGLYLPSAIATITSLVARRNWGKAIAIHELAPNIAFIAVPLLVEFLLTMLSWRGLLLGLGAATLAAGVVFASLGQGGRFAGTSPSPTLVRELLRMPSFWNISVLFAMGIAATVGVFAMLPLFLVSVHGLEEAWANTLVGMSRIVCPPMALVAGWAADRFGVRRTISVTLALTGTATMLIGGGTHEALILGVFLQPAFAVGFFPAGFSALASIGSPEMRNAAVSLAIPLAFVLGAGIVPWLLGVAGDFGMFGWGFAGIGLFILFGSRLACRIKKREEDHATTRPRDQRREEDHGTVRP